MDVRDIVKAAQEQDWQVSQTKGSHLQFKAPDGRGIVYHGTSPSDQRSVRNLIGDLRRHGFIWPWAGQRKQRK